VLAHELGHHVHGDLGKGILVQSALTLGGLWLASLILRWGVTAFGFNGIADVAAMPLLALAMGVFGLVTMPLSNTYSRWRESLADRYALETTRKPQAFAASMTRLADQNLSEADPSGGWKCCSTATRPSAAAWRWLRDSGLRTDDQIGKYSNALTYCIGLPSVQHKSHSPLAMASRVDRNVCPNGPITAEAGSSLLLSVFLTHGAYGQGSMNPPLSER
jgi:hypothetical protein